MSYTQLALQQCGWDARASGPEGASAHANKIRANGRRVPSSDRSAPNAPGSGPGRTRLHFHYTHLSSLCDSQSVSLFSLRDTSSRYHYYQYHHTYKSLAWAAMDMHSHRVCVALFNYVCVALFY